MANRVGFERRRERPLSPRKPTIALRTAVLPHLVDKIQHMVPLRSPILGFSARFHGRRAPASDAKASSSAHRTHREAGIGAPPDGFPSSPAALRDACDGPPSRRIARLAGELGKPWQGCLARDGRPPRPRNPARGHLAGSPRGHLFVWDRRNRSCPPWPPSPTGAGRYPAIGRRAASGTGVPPRMSIRARAFAGPEST